MVPSNLKRWFVATHTLQTVWYVSLGETAVKTLADRKRDRYIPIGLKVMRRSSWRDCHKIAPERCERQSHAQAKRKATQARTGCHPREASSVCVRGDLSQGVPGGQPGCDSRQRRGDQRGVVPSLPR